MTRWGAFIRMVIDACESTLFLSQGVKTNAARHAFGGKTGLRRYHRKNPKKLYSLSEVDVEVGVHPERILNKRYHGKDIVEQAEKNDKILTSFKRLVSNNKDAQVCTASTNIIYERETDDPSFKLYRLASEQALQRMIDRVKETSDLYRGNKTEEDIEMTDGHQPILENWERGNIAARLSIDGELTEDDKAKVKKMVSTPTRKNKKKVKYEDLVEIIREKRRIQDEFSFRSQAATRVVNGELTDIDMAEAKKIAGDDKAKLNAIVEDVKSRALQQNEFGWRSQAAALSPMVR